MRVVAGSKLVVVQMLDGYFGGAIVDPMSAPMASPSKIKSGGSGNLLIMVGGYEIKGEEWVCLISKLLLFVVLVFQAFDVFFKKKIFFFL